MPQRKDTGRRKFLSQGLGGLALGGKQGNFRFKTIFPGTYPAATGWMRPPHIHFKVSKRGYVELTTQMYFPGHPLNEKDRLIRRKPEAEQQLMIAEKAGKIPRPTATG